jgi:arginine utilization protein RocB
MTANTITIEHAHIVRRNPGVFDAATEAQARDMIRAETLEHHAPCTLETLRARAADASSRNALVLKFAAEARQVETIDAMLARSRQAQDAKSRAEAAERRKDRHALIIAAIAVTAIALLWGIDPAHAFKI